MSVERKFRNLRIITPVYDARILYPLQASGIVTPTAARADYRITELLVLTSQLTMPESGAPNRYHKTGTMLEMRM